MRSLVSETKTGGIFQSLKVETKIECDFRAARSPPLKVDFRHFQSEAESGPWGAMKRSSTDLYNGDVFLGVKPSVIVTVLQIEGHEWRNPGSALEFSL